MNVLFAKGLKNGCAWVGGFLALLWVTGCGSLDSNSNSTADAGMGANSGRLSTEAPVNATTAPGIDASKALPPLRVGDSVTVTFMDLPANSAIPECKERIRDDGILLLPYQVAVQAAGKTATELQDAIQKAYVPRLYTRLTVSVKTEERVYYVDGEVKNPNRFPYLSEITVLRAIGSAGGFTDFANKKNIELRRSNGETFRINWDKARKNPKEDRVVFPNDQIIVHQRKI